MQAAIKIFFIIFNLDSLKLLVCCNYVITVPNDDGRILNKKKSSIEMEELNP